MTSLTLTQKLTDAGIVTTLIDLHQLTEPNEFWVFPDQWQSISAEGLPPDSLVSANISETVEGQTSVTVTSAWSLAGPIAPLSLLTGFVDPPPPDSEVLSTWQNGPTETWYGAAITKSIIYRVKGLKLTGFTRFDLLVDNRDKHTSGGVLLQRTFNSPVNAAQPQCIGLSTQVADTLVTSDGGQ